MTTPLDLVAYNRKWLRLHENNAYQAEAARRITALLDEVERLRAVVDMYTDAWATERAEKESFAATVDRVRALIEESDAAPSWYVLKDDIRASIAEGTDS